MVGVVEGRIADLHLIESGRDVPHQAHEEEGDLQDGIGKEVQAVHELVIPGGLLKVDDERKHP